mgnify:CR=1 FL=1
MIKVRIFLISRYLITLSLGLLVTISTYGQSNHQRKSRFLAGIFHNKNLNIYGLSLGLSSFEDQKRFTNSYGIKLEALGIGIALPLAPVSLVAKDSLAFAKLMAKPPSEHIYGVNLSVLGTMCNCVSNGIVLGGIGQYNRQVNGVSFSTFINSAQRHSGFQFAAINESFVMNGVQMGYINSAFKARGIQMGLANFSVNTMGLQLGVFNHSKNLKGIQIGIWNVNPKRQLPFINWDF